MTPTLPRKLLGPVLLLALTARVWGLGFGLPFASSRVDETAIAGPAVGFLSGALRPPDFMYPTGFLYAVALLYAGWFAVTYPFGLYPSLSAFADRRYQTIEPFFYLTRGLSALMGTLTVWWVFAICRRVFDETVAIVAALFMALAYLHVRDSHFGTIDVTLTAMVVLSVLVILRWQDRPDPWRAAIAGLIGGLATSTKYNALGVWVPFAVAAVQQTIGDPVPWHVALRRTSWAVAIYGAAFALGFFATSPYTLFEWDRFMRDVAAQRVTLAQGHGLALSRGWWHHASITLPAALGWPLYAAGVAGTVWGLVRSRRAAVVFAFPLAYYLVAGSGYRVFARDMLPVLPFLCIAAAWLTVTMVNATMAQPRLRGWAIAITTCAIIAPSAINVRRLDRILVRPDNRMVVAEAAPAIIPPGSLVYQSGEQFGRVPFYLSTPPLDVTMIEYDAARSRFVPDGTIPTWIVLQRSPLILYSPIPDDVDRLVRERYELIRHFAVATDSATRIYDQQDALFLPLSGLAGVERIGPTLDIYRLRETQ